MAKKYEADTIIDLGTVAVDSGQLYIVDPCQLKTWKDGEYNSNEAPTNDYAKACTLTMEEGHGQIKHGVVSQTALGDGSYSVKGFTNEDGIVTQIVIDLNPLGLIKDSEFFGWLSEEDEGEE